MSPKVLILIVNWNNYDQTRTCLESVFQINYSNISVYLIDNGSADESSTRLASEFPEVVLIENDTNDGFAAGNNLGIRKGLETDSKYFLLLNNDTEVTNPEFLSMLVDYCEAHSEVGVVGPKVRLMNGAVQNTIGYFPSVFNSIRYGFFRRPSKSLDESAVVDSLSGVCLLVKRAAIEYAGLLDESFFMYVEEHEWLYRIRSADFLVQFLPVESIRHYYGLSAKKISKRAYILKRANTVYMLAKHGYHLQARVTWFLYIVYHIIRILYNDRGVYPSLREFSQEIQNRWLEATSQNQGASALLE